MIRDVGRGIVLFLLCLMARGQTLDDAAADLARKISARLAPAEVARVTTRNISSLSAADAAKLQPALVRALQRRVREPKPVDVAVTISENLRGYLLVAELKRENDTAVEMADFLPKTPEAGRPAVAIASKLLWEQDAPILDLAIVGDQMLVLDTAGITLYDRIAGKWEKSAQAPIATNVRDARGKLQLDSEAVKIELPGMICMGPAKLTSALHCEEGGRFVAGRNTLASDGREFFESVDFGGDTLVADPDGRVHMYDAARAQKGVIDGWGSDFAVVSACGARRVIATGAGDLRSSDSVTAYDLVNRAPVRASDPVEFAGPVTALWPGPDGALAVARNLKTGKSAAYDLALDCGR